MFSLFPWKWITLGFAILWVVTLGVHTARIGMKNSEIEILTHNNEKLKDNNDKLNRENQRIVEINKEWGALNTKQSLAIKQLEDTMMKQMDSAAKALAEAKARGKVLVARADSYLKKPDVSMENQCLEAFRDVDLYLGIRHGK